MTLIETLNKRKTVLTAEELAELLSISRRFVYEHAKASNMPSFKIGEARRFDPKAIHDWLQKKNLTGF